jgi:hypothetical protein
MQKRGIKKATTGARKHPGRLTKFVQPPLRNRTKMATKTIARPRTPVPPAGNPPDPTDLLENKLAQLKSLTWVCYGGGVDWFGDRGREHLDNVLWTLGLMAEEAEDLFQQSEKARNEAPGPGR